MESYTTLFARSRMLVVAFVVAMTALAVWGLTRLGFDDIPRGLFASDDEAHERLQLLYEEFGSDDNDVLLVLTAEDWFAPACVEYLRSLASRLRATEGVASTSGLADAIVFDGLVPRPLLRATDDPDERDEARLRAQAHPLIGGRLLSADGRTTLVVVRLEGNALSIREIEPLTEVIRGIAEDGLASARAQLRMTGIPSIRVEIYQTIRREQLLFFGLGSLLCVLLGSLLFRSLGAVIVASIPPLVGSMWALGFVGLVGERIDILGTVLPALVIVIGFTDSVHLLSDVRGSRAHGSPPIAAATEAIRHVGLPCALTSLTTAVGFGSLALGNAPMIRRFGLLSAMSVILAFLAVITVLPLLASAVPWVGTARAPGAWTARLSRWFDALMVRARPVTVGAIVVSFALLALSTRLVPENRLTEALPRGEAYDALLDCEKLFGGVLPCYFLVEWSEPTDSRSPELFAVLDEVEELCRSRQELSAPLSVLGLLELLPGGRERPAAALDLLPDGIVRRFLRRDLSKAIVIAHVPDGGTDVMGPLYEGLASGLSEISARHPSIDLHLTGTDFIARSNVNQMIIDLAKSLAFAALVIFVVIAIEFRSFVLGLASLLPNLFPLVVIGALLVVTGQPLQMSGAVLFTVLLGLAVDDTIHFLARLRREERETSDRRVALRRSFLAVGKAIGITTIVLGAGFAVLNISAVPTTRAFAWFACVGLVAAFVGDVILLPALLAFRTARRPRTSAPPERSPG